MDEPTLKIGYRANNARAKSVTAGEAAQSKLSGGSVETNRKMGAGNSVSIKGTDGQKMAKLDRDNEVAPPSTVDKSVGKAIAEARQKKEPKWTQKDLASRINEQVQTVASYESAGSAVPNPQVLSKMQRHLGVKLQGANIGEPLGGPKKK